MIARRSGGGLVAPGLEPGKPAGAVKQDQRRADGVPGAGGVPPEGRQRRSGDRAPARSRPCQVNHIDLDAAARVNPDISICPKVSPRLAGTPAQALDDGRRWSSG